MNYFARRLLALRFIIRILALSKSEDIDDALKQNILSDDRVWFEIVGIANGHWLSASLWSRIKDKKVAAIVPEQVAGYCRDVYALNSQRNRRMRGQLIELVEALNAVGITPVLLKGAKHLLINSYQDIGERMMMDIDILVPEKALSQCNEVMRAIGYYDDGQEGFDYSRHHHSPPMCREGAVAAVEVHHKLTRNYNDIVSVNNTNNIKEWLVDDDLRVGLLSPACRILHSIVHSQLVDRGYAKGILPLRSLHEVVLETGNNDMAAWSDVRHSLSQGGHIKLYKSYVYLAVKLFGMSSPHEESGGINAWLYYRRCCIQLAWPWFDKVVMRMDGLSSEGICKKYKCKKSFSEVNRRRVEELKGMVGL